MLNIKYKWIIKIIIFAILFLLIYEWIYFSIISKYSACTRLTMHEMRTLDNLEIVFIGSSKTYSTVNPFVIKERTGLEAFDLASGGQGMMGGYYMMGELLEYQKPKYIVLEVQPSTLRGYENDIKGMGLANVGILDHISIFKKNYWKCFFNTYDVEDYFGAFVKIYHYRYNLTKDRLVERYSNNEIINIINYKPIKYYFGRGHIVENTNNVGKDLKIENNESKYNKEIFSESIKYLEKIQYLCDKNNCQLILLSQPSTNIGYLRDKELLQSTHDFCSRYAEKNHDIYIDMNLNKQYMGKIKDDQLDFIDTGHMNVDGAKKYSVVLGEMIIGAINSIDITKEFYQDYDKMYEDIIIK